MKFDVLIDPINLINKFNCIIVYGKDVDIAYSLFDEFHGIMCDITDLNQMNLKQKALLPEPDLKVKATSTEIAKFLKQNPDLSTVERKVIFLTDKAVAIKNGEEIAEIVCDRVNIKKFIAFHQKRLGYKFNLGSDVVWIQNLHDLHFANRIFQINQNDCAEQSNTENSSVSCVLSKIEGEVHSNLLSLVKKGDAASLKKAWSNIDNPWSFLRHMQYASRYRSDGTLLAMYKHLEMWAHRTVPHEEVLTWLVGSILLNK